MLIIFLILYCRRRTQSKKAQLLITVTGEHQAVIAEVKEDMKSSRYQKGFRDHLKSLYISRHKAAEASTLWVENLPLLMNDVYLLGRLLHSDSGTLNAKTVRLLTFGDDFQLHSSGILWAFAFKGRTDCKIRVASVLLRNGSFFDQATSLDATCPGNESCDLKEIYCLDYRDDMRDMKPDEVYVIGRDPRNIPRHVVDFRATHCMFFSTFGCELSHLFNLGMAVLSGVSCYFIGDTVFSLLNQMVFVLPDISTIQPIVNCHQVQSVIDTTLHMSTQRLPFYRISLSDLLSHNKYFSVAIDRHIMEGELVIYEKHILVF